MTTATTETPVSRNCARGKHHRCLGTVLIRLDAQEGSAYVPCGCRVDGCDHGPRPAT